MSGFLASSPTFGPSIVRQLVRIVLLKIMPASGAQADLSGLELGSGYRQCVLTRVLTQCVEMD